MPSPILVRLQPSAAVAVSAVASSVVVVVVAPASVSPVVGGTTVVLDSLNVEEGSLLAHAAATRARAMPAMVSRARTDETTTTPLGLFRKGTVGIVPEGHRVENELRPIIMSCGS
jgi:hypothetical protein